MNGYELYNKVIARLGFKRFETGAKDSGLLSRTLELINQICLDLNLKESKNLNENMQLTESEKEALICGVAMLFSLSEGDSEKNKIYTDLYNARRAALLSKTSQIEDVLPKNYDGVV